MRIFVCLFFAIATFVPTLPSAPIVLNHSETAKAGDVIYLQGSGFGSKPIAEFSYGDSNWQPLAPYRSAHGLALVRLPPSETRLPDLLTVRVSADRQSWSEPVFINRAQVLWLDSDQIVPGGSIRIFGRNLLFQHDPTVEFADAADTNLHFPAQVDHAKSSPYMLQVKAPATLPPGHTYQLLVGNGTSDSPQPSPQTVMARASAKDDWELGVAWAADFAAIRTNRYDTQNDDRLSLHTVGDGATDETEALNAAIRRAAHAGGGVVYLPAGEYRLQFPIGCGLTLPGKVVLMGAGKGETILQYGFGEVPPQADKGGYAVCFGSQTGISDMTLENLDQSGKWPQSALAQNADEVFLQRVDWNIGGSRWLTFAQDKHLAIENSSIKQKLPRTHDLGPLNLEACNWCEIKGNTIQFVLRGMSFDGMTDSVFEDNKVIRDISISPDAQKVTHSIAASFVANLAVLNNEFESRGKGIATNNDGEVLNSEGGGPSRRDEMRGSVSTATSDSLTDTGQDFHQLHVGSAQVAIVSGDSLGQVRTVTGISPDGHTLRLDRNFQAPVESGSHYATFDWSASNWLVANNKLTGNFKGIEIFNASASNVIIEANQLTDSGGIMVSPTQDARGTFQFVQGLEITGNTLTDQTGWRPAYVGILPREDGQRSSFGVSVLGARVEANRIIAHLPNAAVANPSWDDSKAISEGFLNYWIWQSPTGSFPSDMPPPILGTIFQANIARNSRIAFVLNTGASETAIVGNTTENASSPMQDEALPGSRNGSSNTVRLDH